MNFEDDEEWDLDLIDNLVRKEEEAIAAKRASQFAPSNQPLCFPSFRPLLKTSIGQASTIAKTQSRTLFATRHSQRFNPSCLSAPRVGVGNVAILSSGHIYHPQAMPSNQEQVLVNSKTVPSIDGACGFFSSGLLAGGTAILPAKASDAGFLAEENRRDKPDSFDHDASFPCHYPEVDLPPVKAVEFQNKNGKTFVDSYTSMPEQGGWRFAEVLSDKENMIMEPYYRLPQAGKELSVPCKRASSVGAISLNAEQMEVERLLAQLLFKDQELLEARRSCAEKSEQLKRAIDETAKLKKEYDIKRLRQSEAQMVEGVEDSLASKCNFSQPDVTVIGCISGQTQTKIGVSMSRLGIENYLDENQHIKDLWLPPWTTGGAAEPPDDKQIMQSSGAVQSQGKPAYQKDEVKLAIVAELKARTNDDGCRSMAEQEKHSGVITAEVQELPCRVSTALAEATRYLGSKTTAKEGIAQKRRFEQKSYIDSQRFSHKLLKIWSVENAKEDCLGLVSKLFAACQTDLCVLLTSGSEFFESMRDLSGVPPDLYAILDRTEKTIVKGRASSDCIARDDETERGFLLALELYSVLAKVANGLTSSWALLALLLNFGNFKNVQVVQSALHVMRFILLHDPNCRQELFKRTFLQPNVKVGAQEILFLAEKNMQGETQKRENTPLPTDIAESNKPVITGRLKNLCFDSPRIFFKLDGADRHKYQKRGNYVCQTNLGDPQEKSSREGIWKDGPLEDTSNHSRRVKYHTVLTFFNWILNLALNAATLPVKFEATAILTLLVVHTEPIIDREIFGSLIVDGTVAALLKRSAGLDVQLQAVRLVHLLLHCPSLLKSLCAAKEEQTCISGHVKEGNLCTLADNKEECKVHEGSSLEVAENKTLPVEVEVFMVEPVKRENQRKLLESLSCCLFCMGRSLQEYALRRSALRVLVFIATSGNAGAAAVMGIRVASHEYCSDKDADADAGGGGYGENTSSNVLSIPVNIISLLNVELNIEEEEGDASSMMVRAEERACLIREALTLLCRLACHSTQSTVALAALTTHKPTVRLSISVANRLINKGLRSVTSISDKFIHVPSQDVRQLAKGLRRKILASLPES